MSSYQAFHEGFIDRTKLSEILLLLGFVHSHRLMLELLPGRATKALDATNRGRVSEYNFIIGDEGALGYFSVIVLQLNLQEPSYEVDHVFAIYWALVHFDVIRKSKAFRFFAILSRRVLDRNLVVGR